MTISEANAIEFDILLRDSFKVVAFVLNYPSYEKFDPFVDGDVLVDADVDVSSNVEDFLV